MAFHYFVKVDSLTLFFFLEGIIQSQTLLNVRLDFQNSTPSSSSPNVSYHNFKSPKLFHFHFMTSTVYRKKKEEIKGTFAIAHRLRNHIHSSRPVGVERHGKTSNTEKDHNAHDAPKRFCAGGGVKRHHAIHPPLRGDDIQRKHDEQHVLADEGKVVRTLAGAGVVVVDGGAVDQRRVTQHRPGHF